MPKPFRWNTPAEKDIEKGILHFLNYQVGCFAFKVDTQARFDPRLGTYRKLNSLIMAGTPDIIACYSVDGIGVFLTFEVKTEKGRQSAHQKEFEEKLKTRANGFYFVVRSIKDVENALSEVAEKVRALKNI